MRVAVAICTHCWFKYLNVSCRLKLMMVEWLFLAMPRGCLRFVIVVFPDHTHLLFFSIKADSFPDASKLYGKKSKRLRILPGYFRSTYGQTSPILNRGYPKVLINEVQSFKMFTILIMQEGLSN